MANSSGDTMPPVTSFMDSRVDLEAPPAETTSPVADPAPATETTETPPASATTSPVTETPDAAAPQDVGPIPFERHKAILDGERNTRTELESKVQRIAWAESLDPAQVQAALELYREADQNPMGFLERYHALLNENPAIGPQVRSWAGRVLGGGRQAQAGPQQAQPDTDVEPKPDFMDEATGQPIFSAARLAQWQAWRERQFEARINERLNPLVESHQAHTRQLQFEQEKGRIQADLKQQLEDFRQKPHFKEHEADIKAYLASKNWNASIADAYVHVLTTKVLPTLSQTAKADTLAELRQQAAASSVKPSQSAPAIPADIRSFNDPRLKF